MALPDFEAIFDPSGVALGWGHPWIGILLRCIGALSGRSDHDAQINRIYVWMTLT